MLVNFAKRFLCLILAIFPALVCCNAKEDSKFNHEWIIYPDDKEEETKGDMFTFPWKNSQEVSILSPEWMSYYYDHSNYLNIVNYYAKGKEVTIPKSPVLRWEFSLECDNYTVLIANNQEMDNPSFYTSNENSYVLKDLYAGTTYYYQIKAELSDKTVISKRKLFKTFDFFRTIEINGVFNARDLGNKKTIRNKKVKQGLVYRSANLDGVTPSGIEQAQKYQIKTDLDLREQGPTSSPLGEDVNYINNGVGQYGSPVYCLSSKGVSTTAYKKPMLENLRVFADKNSFPLVFHCAVGRDRTGTLAITLLLLLEVELQQIKEDYVVSFFSKACNSESINDYTLLMEDLIDYYTYYRSKTYGDSESPYTGVEHYCLDIGLSKEEIKAIRENLLEN